MKIVIELSDKIYDTILDDEMPTNEQMAVIVQRIYEGTPLPKGHGRIKDIDKIEWYGGYGSIDLIDGKPHRFCQNCGAKME